jgi:hypothetical protein
LFNTFAKIREITKNIMSPLENDQVLIGEAVVCSERVSSQKSGSVFIFVPLRGKNKHTPPTY